MPQPKSEPRLETKPLDWFIPDPDELARHDDPEEIRLQGLDMLARGQLQPVAALENGDMIFGHGRLLAAKSAALKTLETKVYPAMDRKHVLLTRTSENLKRKSLTPYRTYLLFDELIKAIGCSQKELAVQMNVNEATVCRNLSPSKCIQEVLDALKAGTISMSDCYEISKSSQDHQSGLLAKRISGAASNRDDLAREGRSQRDGNSSAGSTKRESISVLVDGFTITVRKKGDLSLDDAIKQLPEALKELERARKAGHDARTLAALMKKRAKASTS